METAVQKRVGARIGPSGRPPKIPWGYRRLIEGKSRWTPELEGSLVEQYYAQGGNLLGACATVGVAYPAARQWLRERPDFAQHLQDCDAMLRDLVHAQFMQRVLSPKERNPAWKLAYFRKHFPEYVDRQAAAKISITLTDSTIRPVAIEASEVRRLPPGPNEPEGAS
jgi:hypothetical protein